MHLIYRRMLCFIFIITLIFHVSVAAYAQSNPSINKSESILKISKMPNLSLKKLSLLDPERFTMRNQYSMNFSSANGSGSLIGTYINTMEYHFNAPLMMRLKVAYQSGTNNLFGNNMYSGNPNYQNGRLFIPSFDIVYKPWKNMTVSFIYRDYSSYYQNNSYSRSRLSPLMRY